MTFGQIAIILLLCDRELGPLGRSIVIFGRVPLFVYIVHRPLIVLAAGIWRYGHNTPAILATKFPFLFDLPPENVISKARIGVSMPVVYLIAFAMVAVMFLLSRWYANIKKRHHLVWLRYI